MYHIHQSLRAHFSGRNRGTPELRTGADTLIRPAHANATTAGCRTTGRPRTAAIQNQTHRRNWQCVNTVKKTIITTSYPLFWASAPKGAKHSHLITYGHSFRPYVRTSVCPYVRTSVRLYVCTSVRPYVRTSVRTAPPTQMLPYGRTGGRMEWTSICDEMRRLCPLRGRCPISTLLSPLPLRWGIGNRWPLTLLRLVFVFSGVGGDGGGGFTGGHPTHSSVGTLSMKMCIIVPILQSK
jgi:hypothetical protein